MDAQIKVGGWHMMHTEGFGSKQPYAPISKETENPDSYCESIFRKACRTRHLITWLLVGSLLAGVAVFLFVYAVPLVDKAHDVADEALSITTLARDKLEGIDKQVADFLEGGNEKLEEVGEAATAVQELAARMQTVLDSLQETNAAMQAQLQETPPPAPLQPDLPQ